MINDLCTRQRWTPRDETRNFRGLHSGHVNLPQALGCVFPHALQCAGELVRHLQNDAIVRTLVVAGSFKPNAHCPASPNTRPAGSPLEVSLSIAVDPASRFAEYAHPERLVSTEWLSENLGTPGLVVIEANEDILLYDTGHIPGAVKLDWHTELNDPVERDFLGPEAFAELASSKGISRDSAVVIYGDNNNWWAAYALWVFTLFGHIDVRLLDGGRAKWIAEGRDITRAASNPARAEYPIIQRQDSGIRAYREDVFAHFGKPLIDVRSPEEYSGARTEIPGYPTEASLRAGHIPSAASVPWARAAAPDATFRSRDELAAIYLGEAGLDVDDDVVAYCRIGERSSHTWFVLTYLLGFKNVRNYDGSWTEWGSLVRVPIATGTEPGIAPEPRG